MKRPLEINDYVIYMHPRYRKYVLGKIGAFTKTKVRVFRQDQWSGDILQTPERLVKVEGEDLTAYFLKK